jgi:hypothetical protein
MSTLSKDLRSKLEKAILVAREEATKGAKSAFIALGVGDAKKPQHLDAAEEALRKRLRARGRQAGDLLRPDESQETTHLEQECAYEHWHRMLFARFLIENGLLMQPGSTLDVNFEHCEEEGKRLQVDPWEVAADYGQHMLPAVFRQDDPVLQLRLPPEARNKLTTILNELPVEVFKADDSLGWTYQFWQTKRRKEVNESEKVGADDISSATQLFTEDYMVEFLLHNTLGAWWAGKHGPIQAATEQQAREKVSLPLRNGVGIRGVLADEDFSKMTEGQKQEFISWTYLRFIRDEDTKSWSPAAGSFDAWPREAKNITFLDPCMGSGHFPILALPILVRLRIEEEGLTVLEAVNAVLRDNIHGLELDPRCCQIGAFNLALTAWKLAGYQPLPPLHIACCGLAPRAKLADWVSLAGDNDKLVRGMERLYRLFEQAPILGSLINPLLDGDLIEAGFREFQPLLERAMTREVGDSASSEIVVTAWGLAKAAEILAAQFTLVATNVPYLGRGKQHEVLQNYCEKMHPSAQSDLATCFVERCLTLCKDDAGSTALVTPQNWLFLDSYKQLRETLLREVSWNMVARLGPKGFQTPMWDFNVMLWTSSRAKPKAETRFIGIDVSMHKKPALKATKLREEIPSFGWQHEQLLNPDFRIVQGEVSRGKKLSEYAVCFQGTMPADRALFIRSFWELLMSSNSTWKPLQSSSEGTMDCGGLSGAFDLDSFEKRYKEVGGRYQGTKNWGKLGICISQMSTLPVSRYFGNIYDGNIDVVVPKDGVSLSSLWCFFSSGSFAEEIRKLEQKLDINTGTILKVPFDFTHWENVAADLYPDGLPAPSSEDATQWLFGGHPKGSKQPLHVAVARLLGYQWPRQSGSSFPDCPALGPDGLESFADEDGIVCLTSLRGEGSASDRLREILSNALDSFEEPQLIVSAGKKGSKSETLHDWLRDEFFEQHCDLFHQRPFIWHIWDGRKDGFHAFVNYHKLAGPNGTGRRTLESLVYSYLGDWITRQRDAVTQGEPGADDRLAAALELKGLLEQILAGEPPYDLFVRWKPLHEQAIGWAPDLNDGVRLNARPFLVKDLSRGKKNAGIFRSKINLNWKKDRGTEPDRAKEDYPWFWNWDEATVDFLGTGNSSDGARWNDLHYTTALKQNARNAHVQKGSGL